MVGIAFKGFHIFHTFHKKSIALDILATLSSIKIK